MTMPWWMVITLLAMGRSVSLMVIGPGAESWGLPVLAGGIFTSGLGGAVHFWREGSRALALVFGLIGLAFLARWTLDAVLA